MKSKEFARKAVDIAKNYKTLYVMGCFGAPMTAKNKDRYTKNHSYNRSAQRTAMIRGASEDTFGFDCVCLIKGILWGWNGDGKKVYGGSVYTANGVPDIGADAMIQACREVSKDFSDIQVGEAVWKSGHIGIYIGDGLAVECTPAWGNKVQITAVGNLGSQEGYPTRMWTKHGKLPYVDYSDQTERKHIQATAYADSFLALLAGTYRVTAKKGLNVRHGAGVTKKKMVAIPYGTKVQNYGYYSTALGQRWLYIRFLYQGVQYTGFASAKYLKR